MLHPKLTNRFVVLFGCQFEADEIFSLQDGVDQTEMLSSAVVRVSQPNIVFGSFLPRARPPFRDIIIDGNLEITFEDDVTGRLSKALQFITKQDVGQIKIDVVKLDGGDRVLEAHVYCDIALVTLAHSVLDYSGQTGGAAGSFQGKMTDNSLNAIDLKGSIDLSQGSTVRKTLAGRPRWAMMAHYENSGPTVAEFIGQM